MKNGIYSIYMGSSENIDKIENTTCFSLIEKESKSFTFQCYNYWVWIEDNNERKNKKRKIATKTDSIDYR